MKLLFVMLSCFALSYGNDDLMLSHSIIDQSQVLNNSELDGVVRSLGWDVIRIRSVFELGVEVPYFTNFSINPEIELYFTKK